MTGTAETEAPEFDKIYRLEVIVIPTNRTLLRKENPDIVYRTEKRSISLPRTKFSACTTATSQCWWALLQLKSRSGFRSC